MNGPNVQSWPVLTAAGLAVPFIVAAPGVMTAEALLAVPLILAVIAIAQAAALVIVGAPLPVIIQAARFVGHVDGDACFSGTSIGGPTLSISCHRREAPWLRTDLDQLFNAANIAVAVAAAVAARTARLNAVPLQPLAGPDERLAGLGPMPPNLYWHYHDVQPTAARPNPQGGAFTLHSYQLGGAQVLQGGDVDCVMWVIDLIAATSEFHNTGLSMIKRDAIRVIMQHVPACRYDLAPALVLPGSLHQTARDLLFGQAPGSLNKVNGRTDDDELRNALPGMPASFGVPGVPDRKDGTAPVNRYRGESHPSQLSYAISLQQAYRPYNPAAFPNDTTHMDMYKAYAVGFIQSDGTSDARGDGDKFTMTMTQNNVNYNDATEALIRNTNLWVPGGAGAAGAGGALALADLHFDAHGVYFSGPACLPLITNQVLSFFTGKRPDFEIQRVRFNTDPANVQAMQGYTSPQLGDRAALRWFHNPN
jgi:hypothetical protein